MSLKENMSQPFDGARNALSGLLYQAIVDLGLVARAISSAGESTSDDEVNALLEFIGSGSIQSEVYGQDSLLRSLGIDTKQCVLLQYKYSRQIPPPAISKNDLRDIANGLGVSSEVAKLHGEEVTRFALFSNRPLSNSAKELLANSNNNDPDPTPPDAILRWVLSKLFIAEPDKMEPRFWLATLETLGERYGLSKQEAQHAIGGLFGTLAVIKFDGGIAVVDRGILLKLLVGSATASPLVPHSVAKVTAERTGELLLHMNVGSAPLKRKILDEISQASMQRALVILSGDGGSGKTLALFQWANDNANAQPANQGAFVEVLQAREINRNWIASTVSTWIGLSRADARCHETIDQALGRLLCANRGLLHPILHLGMDALDEYDMTSESRTQVAEILNWFYSEDQRAQKLGTPPRATLIVTCREKQVLDEWLIGDYSGFSDMSDKVREIHVPDFSMSELIAVAGHLSRDVQNYLSHSSEDLQPEPATSFKSSSPIPVFAAKEFVALKTENDIVESLKHPIMWQSFSALPEKTRLDVLRNDTVALEQMAASFIKRFFRKLRRRGKVQFQESQLLLVLGTLSTQCQARNREIFDYSADWIDVILDTRLLTQKDAHNLYIEALSAGLIKNSDARSWYWRHRVVWGYLVTSTAH